MRTSRLKTIFWLLLGVLTVVCSAHASLLDQTNCPVEDQSSSLDQTAIPQPSADWQAELLWIRPREKNGDCHESRTISLIGLDKASSIRNTLQELRLTPEPVTLAVLMVGNLLTASLRLTHKYRPQLR